MSIPIVIIISIIACAAGAAAGAYLYGKQSFQKGILYRQQQAEAAIGSAEQEADKIRREASRMIESARAES